MKGTASRAFSAVSPFTRPTSSSLGFLAVTTLTRSVTTKQITHAHHARQKLTAMSLAVEDSVMEAGLIHWNLTARNRKKDEPMPASKPQNAPLGVIQTTNMPSSIVANSGALTHEKMAC